MKPSTKMLHGPVAAVSLLMLQPVQAQAPAQPGAASAASTDAADIQQQAADAFGKAVSAAARCDREELTRQLALLESLNARMTQVSQNAAAGARAARRIPTEFGGPPEGDNSSIVRAENAVFRLVTHARSLVPACGPETTVAAPPAKDIPTLVAEPAPPGFEGKGNIGPSFPVERYGTMPLPPEKGAAEGGGGTPPTEKTEKAPTPGENGERAASQPDVPQDIPPAAPGSAQPKQDAPEPSEATEGSPDQAGQTSAPSPSPRTWPSKTSASDLKARNSETAVEQMEMPSSPMEICEGPEAPEAECGNQQPPPRKPDQLGSGKPR